MVVTDEFNAYELQISMYSVRNIIFILVLLNIINLYTVGYDDVQNYIERLNVYLLTLLSFICLT